MDSVTPQNLQGRDAPVAFVLGLGENGYGIVRSLAREGIATVGIYRRPEDFGRFSRYCRSYYLDPSTHAEEEICDRLIRWRLQWTAKPVLFPSSDKYAFLLAKHAQRLSPYFRYHWVDADDLRRISDKSQVFHACRAAGLTIPWTYATQAGEDLEARVGEIPFPCLIKPNRGFQNTFPVGTRNIVARSPRELLELFNKNPGFYGTTVCQEIIEGDDDAIVQCNILVRESGELGPALCVRKIRQFPPKYGLMSFGRSETNDVVHALASRLMRSLGYRGLASLEFKYRTSDGRYYFIEINPRLPLYNVLIADAGVNLAHLAYLDLVASEKFETHAVDGRPGVHWISLKFELGRLLSTRGAAGLTPLRWIASLARARSFAWWDWRDPAPALGSMLDLFKRGFALAPRETPSVGSSPSGVRSRLCRIPRT